MFCPRCRTELPDSATTCTRCGYPVVQVGQAPQVGQVPVPPSYQSPSYSYLPPGSPQWPTVVPAQLPTAQPRASGENGAGDTPGSMSSAGAGGRSASRKGSLGVPAILGLFIVSILVGGGLTLGLLALQGHFNQTSAPPVSLHVGSTPSTSATTSPQASPSAVGTSQTNLLQTPSTFLSIKNTDVGLSIKYPSDWILDPVQKSGQDATLTMHPSVQNGVLVALQRYGTSSSTQLQSTSAVNSTVLYQFQTSQGVTGLTPIQATTPQQTVGGTAWDEMDATFTTSNGNTYHLTTIAVKYKNLFYNVLYYAPQQVYAEAVQKYFQPMLNSIKFLS
jgi:hypothetical protein